MIYKIFNDKFEASINSYGAQLQEFQSKKTSRQYLWCADESVWGKTSPVLFPQIGRVRDSYIKVGEVVYNMTKHGFARNSEFEIESQTDTKIVLVMHDNDFTRTIYPYAFTFKVKFELCDNVLSTTYEVINNGVTDMYFAVGGHTGYSTEIGGACLDDYKLVFDQKIHLLLEKVDLAHGLLSGEQENLGTSKELNLSAELFANRDTVILKNVKSKSVKLVSNKHNAVVQLDYEDCPTLAIWAAKGTKRFVCLEPWVGQTDSLTTKHTLAKKEGFIKLEAKQTYSAAHRITVTE